METVNNESVTGLELLDAYEADTNIESDKDESDDNNIVTLNLMLWNLTPHGL